MVPVDPVATRLRILARARDLKAEAEKFPKDSPEWLHLNAYVCGLFEAVQIMNGDIEAAIDAEAGGPATLN